MTYRKGDSAPCIANVKRKLNVFPVDTSFDDLLAQRVRGIQSVFGIPVSGVLDSETAAAAGVSHLMEDRWTA